MDRLVVLDTVVLSNFAASTSIDTLVAVLDRPVTVFGVQRELERGSEEGYAHAERALNAIETKIPVVDPPEAPATRFRRDVDSGEAGVLAVAADRNGLQLPTIDRRTRPCDRS